MTTTLMLRLKDSSGEGRVCFGDTMKIPYNTPEQLFTGIFGTENIGIPSRDIKTSRDENSNLTISIVLHKHKRYDFHDFDGMDMLYEITEVFMPLNANTKTIDTKCKDDQQVVSDEDIDRLKKQHLQRFLQQQRTLNANAQEVLDEMYNRIVESKGQDTFDYLFHTLITDSENIENGSSYNF